MYIYNGHAGGLWPRYTQKIKGSDVSIGIKSFGAALTPRSVYQGEGECSTFHIMETRHTNEIMHTAVNIMSTSLLGNLFCWFMILRLQ